MAQLAFLLHRKICDDRAPWPGQVMLVGQVRIRCSPTPLVMRIV